jgi:site-specific DNA-methyltransferase (adenine-specific)
MFQDEVKVPVGDWAQKRLKNLSETDRKRDNSRVGSGFGKTYPIGWDVTWFTQVMYCI